MSERFDDDPAGRLTRAALPVVPVSLRPPSTRADALFAPGRGWLEIAVVLAALSLLVPACGPIAAVAAVTAGRRGNTRATAALVASLWCVVLGLALRSVLGLGVFP